MVGTRRRYARDDSGQNKTKRNMDGQARATSCREAVLATAAPAGCVCGPSADAVTRHFFFSVEALRQQRGETESRRSCNGGGGNQYFEWLPLVFTTVSTRSDMAHIFDREKFVSLVSLVGRLVWRYPPFLPGTVAGPKTPSPGLRSGGEVATQCWCNSAPTFAPQPSVR